MDAESNSFSSNCGHLWPVRYGSFHFCSKSPDKEICVLDRKRIFSQLWGRAVNVCIPSFQLDPEMSTKSDTRQSSNSACGSSMGSRPWYPILLDFLAVHPCLLPVDPLLVHLPWENLPHPFLSHHNFRLAVWPLSGNLCSHRIYQKGCPNFYWLRGKKD